MIRILIYNATNLVENLLFAAMGVILFITAPLRFVLRKIKKDNSKGKKRKPAKVIKGNSFNKMSEEHQMDMIVLLSQKESIESSIKILESKYKNK